MARNEETMDIDIDSDFDNKENSIQHSNVFQHMPCTEKGYEELDVSDLNMKLRYSLTPVSSPMSKSYTANCVDFKNHGSNNDIINANLTRSFNSTINQSHTFNKSVKPLPLQSITTDHLDDNRRSSLIPIILDATAAPLQGSAAVTVSENNEDIEEILPASSSSLNPSPSATTPSRDLPRSDGGSPIMRGLKTVLNMFRSSQSPIPLGEVDITKQDLSTNPPHTISPQGAQTVLASTPIAAHRCKDGYVCNSPHKESIVFNEDLEKELLWKDETTILFSEEKIPIHKLFLQQPNIIDNINCNKNKEANVENVNSSLEYMDVSYDKTITDIKLDTNVVESDIEFLDCETTFTHDQLQNDYKEYPIAVEKISFTEEGDCSTRCDETCENNENSDSKPKKLGETKLQQNSDLSFTILINEDHTNFSNNLDDKNIKNRFEEQTEIENLSSVPLQTNAKHNDVSEKDTNTSVNQGIPGSIIKYPEQNHSSNNNHETIISKSPLPTNTINKSTNNCRESLQNISKKDDLKAVDTTHVDLHLTDREETLIPSTSGNIEQISNVKDLLNNDYENIVEHNSISQESVPSEHIESNRNPITDMTDTDLCINDITIKSGQENVKLNISGDRDANANVTIIIPPESLNSQKETVQMCCELDASQKESNEDIMSNNISITKNYSIDDVENTDEIVKKSLHSVQLLTGFNHYVNKEDSLLRDQPTGTILLDNTETSDSTKNSVKSDLSLNFIKVDRDNPNTIVSNMESGVNNTVLHSIKNANVSYGIETTDDTENSMVQETLLPDLLNSSKDVLKFNIDNVTEKTNNVSKYQEISVKEQVVNKDDIENNIDREMLLSENHTHISNSKEEIIHHHTKKSGVHSSASKLKVSKSSTSPKTLSTGYNFNFEEIVNPFATKTKIRLSPPLDSPDKHNLVENNGSQPGLNECELQEENINTENAESKITDDINLQVEHSKLNNDSNTVCMSYLTDHSPKNNHLEHVSDNSYNLEVKDENVTVCSTDVVCTGNEQNCHDIDNNPITVDSINNSIHAKTTSSSEQSAYFSVATSSYESGSNTNVFNVPEMEDTNFCQLATKSLMSSDFIEGQDTNSEIVSNEEMNANEQHECMNISNITSTSKATDDKEITVFEINTEDEDTIEGPFLEGEDIQAGDEKTVFQHDDANLMQFTDLPLQEIERNIESDELFIDAEAFEFLLNQNQNNVVSNNGKESLFLKFDPLFARRVSNDGVLASLKNVHKKRFTPRKKTVAQLMNSTFEKAGPSTVNLTHENKVDSTFEVTTDDLNNTFSKPIIITPLADSTLEATTDDLHTTVSKPIIPISSADSTLEVTSDDLNTTVSKPMMVVPPAVNPIVALKNKPTTPVSSNRRSIAFTSPAIAVIDRLLSLSGNNSLLGEDTYVMQTNRDRHEADIALTQLRELLAEKETHVYTLRTESSELKDRLSLLESQMRMLETEGEERLKKINDLTETLTEKTKINRNMAAVVEEYERTIASLIAELEQDKKQHNEERIKLMKERDEQTAHLASMEHSFSDIHSKYEKSKQIILSCKANEDTYKKSIKEFEENLSKMQSNYELLKQHATSKLNHANQELEKMNRAHDAEVLKLNAMIKRKDLHITSLEETLAQKTKANEELTAICDELINKVG